MAKIYKPISGSNDSCSAHYIAKRNRKEIFKQKAAKIKSGSSYSILTCSSYSGNAKINIRNTVLKTTQYKKHNRPEAH